MPTVTLNLPQPERTYDVVIEPGLLSRLGEHVAAVAPHARAGIILDEGIETTHGQTVCRSMTQAGFDASVAVMSPSEKRKNLGTVSSLLSVMLEANLERQSPIVTCGGGIVGDTGGFVAASLLRGVPFVQTPTSLLAMVDASVGGKVGVNAQQGKNLVGAFHQPRLVAIDPDTLATLPPRELRCGLAECVKHGMIRDPELFDWIEAHVEAILGLDSGVLVELIHRNVAIKAAVVMEDEKEAGVRAHLNFGHTFAHAIEATTPSGRIKHGEAVALGMVAATGLATDLGRCDTAVLRRLIDLLQAIGLPVYDKKLVMTPQLMASMRHDKKVAGGALRLVVPEGIGRVTIRDDIADAAVIAAWEGIRG